MSTDFIQSHSPLSSFQSAGPERERQDAGVDCKTQTADIYCISHTSVRARLRAGNITQHFTSEVMDWFSRQAVNIFHRKSRTMSSADLSSDGILTFTAWYLVWFNGLQTYKKSDIF
ncbi:uncharacterized protein V6R79_002934 [Siganus canaliculatus]